MRNIPLVTFVLSISVFTFGYGVLVGVYEIFPYQFLADARSAAASLFIAKQQKNWLVYGAPALGRNDGNSTGGVTVHKPDRAYDGLTFYTAFDGEEFGAFLINMNGKLLHRWKKRISAVWPEPEHVEYLASDDVLDWHGVHLFPNGDILFNYNGGNFPFGGGMVKLDERSNVVWSLARNTHHDLNVQDDGTIYVLAHNYLRDMPGGFGILNGPYYEDVVLKVSPDGKVLDEISILSAIRNSDYRGLLSIHYFDRLAPEEQSRGDPTHANGVELVDETLADQFPMFEVGDLIVSLRNLNMVGAISSTTRKLRWALVGPFVRQHDPDLTPSGTVVVYDNIAPTGYELDPGRPGVKGAASRVVEIDPVNQAIVWEFSGTEESPFYSRSRGKQQVLPNGNVLIVEPERGRIFEVTREKEIVWEFINANSNARGEAVEGKVGMVTEGVRIDQRDLTFLN